MKILALETSCDETSAAIVENGRHVLSNIVFSQTALHARFGGVVPEAAAREHIKTVNYVVDKALKAARLDVDDMDAFAATLGPGLIGSLLIGANTAKTLSLLTGKPFLGVNHLYAHVASNYLESDLEPPFLCLLVSGGHTQLIRVTDYAHMDILGETLDDAAGEAYDKVARMLELPYPGGPNLDRLSRHGNPDAFDLPRARTENALDFSFSGLKTACLRKTEQALADTSDDVSGDISKARDRTRADLAASFQKTVVDTLFEKTLACAKQHDLTTITIAGGVSANSALREKFLHFVESNPAYRLFIPRMAFCTDNAAMVAASAFFNPISGDVGDEVFSRAPASFPSNT